MADDIDWDDFELNIETSAEPSKIEEIVTRQSALIQTSSIIRGTPLLFACFLCDFTCPLKIDLITHMAEKHKEDLNCAICKSKFTALIVLIEHVFLFHSRSLWICKVCKSHGGWTGCPFRYHRHLVVEHPYPSKKLMKAIEDKVFVCHFCKTGFRIRENLFLHLIKIHEIDYDILLKLVIRFNMLHERMVNKSCFECCLTFETQAAWLEHTVEACSYHNETYAEFTRRCYYCHFNTTGVTEERYHSYCLPERNHACQKHGKRFTVYSHSKGFSLSGSHRCLLGPTANLDCPNCKHTSRCIDSLASHYANVHDQTSQPVPRDVIDIS